jgi:hypothetical protein
VSIAVVRAGAAARLSGICIKGFLEAHPASSAILSSAMKALPRRAGRGIERVKTGSSMVIENLD